MSTLLVFLISLFDFTFSHRHTHTLPPVSSFWRFDFFLSSLFCVCVLFYYISSVEEACQVHALSLLCCVQIRNSVALNHLSSSSFSSPSSLNNSVIYCSKLFWRSFLFCFVSSRLWSSFSNDLYFSVSKLFVFVRLCLRVGYENGHYHNSQNGSKLFDIIKWLIVILWRRIWWFTKCSKKKKRQKPQKNTNTRKKRRNKIKIDRKGIMRK